MDDAELPAVRIGFICAMRCCTTSIKNKRQKELADECHVLTTMAFNTAVSNAGRLEPLPFILENFDTPRVPRWVAEGPPIDVCFLVEIKRSNPMNSASDSVPKERSGTRRDTGHALANQNIAVFIFPAPCLASQALPLKMDSSTHRLSQADQHSSIVLPETPPGPPRSCSYFVLCSPWYMNYM